MNIFMCEFFSKCMHPCFLVCVSGLCMYFCFCVQSVCMPVLTSPVVCVELLPGSVLQTVQFVNDELEVVGSRRAMGCHLLHLFLQKTVLHRLAVEQVTHVVVILRLQTHI